MFALCVHYPSSCCLCLIASHEQRSLHPWPLHHCKPFHRYPQPDTCRLYYSCHPPARPPATTDQSLWLFAPTSPLLPWPLHHYEPLTCCSLLLLPIPVLVLLMSQLKPLRTISLHPWPLHHWKPLQRTTPSRRVQALLFLSPDTPSHRHDTPPTASPHSSL
jgi:hypothetical protein